MVRGQVSKADGFALFGALIRQKDSLDAGREPTPAEEVSDGRVVWVSFGGVRLYSCQEPCGVK